jgi:hypothetical protein
MLHVAVLIFAVVLGLSLCGVVATILWLVVRRGHRLTAQDLIPLVGFTLSGLVSFLVFTISAASSSTQQKKLPTGTVPPTLTALPSPTAMATAHPAPAATATPTHAPVAPAHPAAPATPRPTPSATARPSATPSPSPTPSATPSPSPAPSATP